MYIIKYCLHNFGAIILFAALLLFNFKHFHSHVSATYRRRGMAENVGHCFTIFPQCSVFVSFTQSFMLIYLNAINYTLYMLKYQGL